MPAEALEPFVSFLMQCAEAQSPLYLAAQLLRVDFTLSGVAMLRSLVLSCHGTKALYIFSALAIIRHKLPFVDTVVAQALSSISLDERELSPCSDNTYVLAQLGLCPRSDGSPEIKELLKRGAPLLAVTKGLEPPSSTPCPLDGMEWKTVRNALLLLPENYFDDLRALDPCYDPFIYLRAHTILLRPAPAPPTPSTSLPSFTSILLSSLSVADFARKTSLFVSESQRQHLVLQALGDTGGDHGDLDVSVWNSARNSPLYIPILRHFTQATSPWLSALEHAFKDLYDRCIHMRFSSVKRIAEACGDAFSCTTDEYVHKRLISFVNMHEEVCCLQRRVFLRFFVIVASPGRVDKAVLDLLTESIDHTAINTIPNTPFSRTLLQNLALVYSYTALLEPLE